MPVVAYLLQAFINAQTSASVRISGVGDGDRVGLWIDYDGDEDLGLFVANDRLNASTAFRLYRQINPLAFEDVTVASGLIKAPIVLSQWHFMGGICAGDINNDGYVDLYAAQWYGPSHLFLNNGDGTFADISASSGIAERHIYGHQPIMVDFNDDGWLDIYQTADFEPNVLWLNQHNNTFVDAAPGTGLDNAMNDMGVALGDFDNDGDWDLYITNVDYVESGVRWHNVLLANESQPGKMSFRDVSVEQGVDGGYWGWGATFFDSDRNGWLDLAATNGWFENWPADPTRYFHNRGIDRPFDELSAVIGLDDLFWGSALVAADLDRDGDVDLVQSCMDGRLRLLECESRRRGQRRHVKQNDHRYLVVKPRMAGPNSHALGARVEIRVHGRSMTRWIRAGTSYLGQEPAEAFFGLGNARIVDKVHVFWPDGNVSERSNVNANSVLTIRRD